MGAIEGDTSRQITQSWSNSTICKVLDITGLVPLYLIFWPDQKAIEVDVSPTECITVIRGQKLRTRKLWSEQRLGISGAWIVVGINVCRMISAVFDVQPRAIILPINLMLQTIGILGQQLHLPEGILQNIITLLNDSDTSIRSTAIDILGQQPNLPDTALQHIITSLSNPQDPYLRKAAIHALGNLLA
ncbi:hypothetical protein FOC4_h10017652, partial [Fusarium odoratissimum]